MQTESTENIQQEQQHSYEDILNMFDVGGKLRKQLLETAESILLQTKSSDTKKLNQGKLIKVLTCLTELCRGQEQIIRGCLGDLIKVGQMLMKHDTTTLTLATQIKALITAVERKGIITEAELQDIAKNEVMPMALKHMDEEAKKAGEEALVK